MSDSQHPEAPPPEVPEEFVAAYRDAYRLALEPGANAVTRTTEVTPREAVLIGAARPPAEDHAADRGVQSARGRAQGLMTQWRASPWYVPSLFALAALVLVPGAYAVGSAVSDDGSSGTLARSTSGSADGRTSRQQNESSDDVPTKGATTTAPGGWNGPVTPVATDAISADCTAPPSRDSAGNKVTYNPENAIDDLLSTAWRCPGTAVGQTLTLRISGPADVAEIGLVPGYAKTDPDSGVDRYAQNNRITKVRWTLADGATFVQRLDPDPSSRDLQLLRVPPTSTDTVRLEILAVERGPRDTTAISEIALYAAK